MPHKEPDYPCRIADTHSRRLVLRSATLLEQYGTERNGWSITNAVNNIPPAISQLPAGPVQLPEQVFNNLLVLESAPNDLVKNPQIHITSSAMRMDFQVYGFPCAVSGVPQVNQGHLVATNVNVEGIAALILTSDQITTLVNKHLADAQTKINHPIESVQLKDKELDLMLGQPGSGGLPPLP